MGKLVPVSLGTRSNPARYAQGGSARLINCYAEDAGGEAKVPWPVYTCDGLQGFAALPEADGGVRASIEVNGALYAVCGTRVYKTIPNGTVTLLGSMNIDPTAPLFMERNRRAVPDIGIVCAGLMYYIRGDVLTQVTDADLLAPTSLTFVKGSFVIGTANNTWQRGEIDDATSWDALDAERADANPDDVVVVASMSAQAVLLGTKSVEFWADNGNVSYDFVTSKDVGCYAAGSVQPVNGTLIFVAHDRSVRMFNGYEAISISTGDVEDKIQKTVDPNTITSCTWVKRGHTFYCISGPDWTWCYDVTTARPHDRQSNGLKRWKIGTVTAFDGKLIAGDATEGKLYEMSADFFDEAGEPLVSEIVLPPVHAFPYPLTFHGAYISIEKGVGSGVGDTQDVNPEIMLSWSEDGGKTWAGERRLSIGRMGKSKQRVRTYRLGQADEDGRVFRLSCSCKVVRAFYGMTLDTDRGEV